MTKRFIDTDIWTKNKWFRKLLPKYKLMWFYLLSSCDSIGIWKEDIELASYIINEKYSKKDILDAFGDRLIILSDNNKWWIKDFCRFQYGILQDNPKNKPHKSYIKLLKNNSLYIEYRKTIYSLKDKDKEKDKEKDKDSSAKKITKEKKKKLGEYKHVQLSKEQYLKLKEKWGIEKLKYMIQLLDEGIQMKGYKYNDFYLTLLKWEKKEYNKMPVQEQKIKIGYDKKTKEDIITYEA